MAHRTPRRKFVRRTAENHLACKVHCQPHTVILDIVLTYSGDPKHYLSGEGHAVVWQVRFLSVFLYILLYYFQIYICNQPVQSIAFWYTLLCNYIPISSTFLAYDSKLYYMAIDDIYNILLNKQCLLYANACFIQENKCSRSCIYCIQQLQTTKCYSVVN